MGRVFALAQGTLEALLPHIRLLAKASQLTSLRQIVGAVLIRRPVS